MIYNIGDLLRVKSAISLFVDYSQPTTILYPEELVVVISEPQTKLFAIFTDNPIYRTVVYMLYHGNRYYFSCFDEEELDKHMPKYFELVQ